MLEKRTLIIIPTYNEKENCEDIIVAILNLNSFWHLLIVDDSSPDGTGKIVLELKNKFENRLFLISQNTKTGLGKAYTKGFIWAINQDYDIICTMDADFSHNPEELPKLLDTLNHHQVDMVIGSRYLNGISILRWSLLRILLSVFASFFVRAITGIAVKDPTAGFNVYRQDLLKELVGILEFNGYAFQVEVKYKAYLKGFKLKEVPIIFTDRVKGKSKMNLSIINEALFGIIYMAINKKKWKNG